jgi:hypothetical protein
MPRSNRTPALAFVAALLCGGLVAHSLATPDGARSGFLPGVPSAHAKDDPVKLKEAREKFRKDQQAKGIACYFDLSYGVDKGKPEKPNVDSRWSMEAAGSDWTENKGVQFRATFSDTKFPAGAQIDFIVQKFLHREGNSEFNIPFERAGLSPKTSDLKGVIEGAHTEYVKTLTDIVKDKTFAEKKSNAGPAKIQSSITGTSPDSKQRIRVDHFGWIGPNTTWFVRVTYSGLCCEKSDQFEERVTELLKYTKSLKAPD